ncbi:MAG: AMP-binding protein [Dehalococcoidia bacterium]|nr:AMP-binding protein [Dehalococcoidia bacterium]
MDSAGIRPGEIRGDDDLPTLPISRKTESMDAQKANPPFGDFVAVPIEQLKNIFVSPGPIFYPRATDEEVVQLRAKTFFAGGFRPGDIVQNCFVHHLVPAGIELGNALMAIGCVVIPAGGGNTELQIEVMRRLKVSGYVGTPSFLNILADKAEESGFNLKKDFALEVGFCGAEMLPESLRKSLEERWGAIVRQSYATADTGLLGYECRELSGMHIPEERMVEIVDPTTGERVPTGQVGEVVASANSRTVPLLRYATGDLSLISDEPCPCGRTSPRILRIVGRAEDSTKVRGMFVYPRQVDEVVAKFPAIAKYQIVVTREKDRDDMTFLVELKEEVNRAELTANLQDRIRDVIKLRAEVEYVSAGTIPEGAKKLVDKRVWT